MIGCLCVLDPEQGQKITDQSGNFLNETLYTNVNLVEQFNQLLKIDMEFKSSIRVLMELKKDRALSLSLDNNLLTESSGMDYSIGFNRFIWCNNKFFKHK